MKTPNIRLPRRLGDPPRKFRRLVFYLILVQFLCFIWWLGLARPILLQLLGFIWGLGFFQHFFHPIWAWYFIVQMVATLPLTLWIWSILPGRAVNAFYLRSFQNDLDAWKLRQAAQAVFGRKFRLSGIRDPRRRWPPIVRYIHWFFFVIRYCHPKFMNLEAGPDWKARLWRSLGDARCALIDITEMTPFLWEEIELCYFCLGLRRILFIGNKSRSVENWRRYIGEAAGGNSQAEFDGFQIAIYDALVPGRKVFADAIKAFVAALPPGAAGIKPETLHLAQTEEAPLGDNLIAEGASCGEVVLGVIMSAALYTVYQMLQPADPTLWSAWKIPVAAVEVAEIWFIVQYLINSSWWERLRSVYYLMIAFSWMVGVLLITVEEVRGAATAS